MILWLDDIRNPDDYNVKADYWAKFFEEAIDFLNNHNITFASLDHDLGACESCIKNEKYCPHVKSGYDVLCWIEENNKWPINGIYVHSSNPVGKEKMNRIIRNHYYR